MFRFVPNLAAMAFGLSIFSSSVLGQSDYFALIEQAIALDPLIKAEEKNAQAAQLRAESYIQWADPQVGLSLANLPGRGSMLRQEGMTQLQLSLSQTLPRGDSLQLGAEIIELKGKQATLKRQLRALQLRRDVGAKWLQLHLAHTTRSYVEQSHQVINELVQVVQAHYGAGKHQLQDVVAAQLEQSRLGLQLAQLDSEIATLTASFNQWLPEHKVSLSPQSKLPSLNLPTVTAIERQISLHPQVQLLQYQVDVAAKDSELASQQLQTQYALQGSLGLRDQDLDGRSRADLFSVGVKMTMPLFGSNKQDAQVEAKVLQSQAKLEQKHQVQLQMQAQYQAILAQVAGWQQQLEIYQQQLLEQFNTQVELALNAYNHDEGEFSALLRANLAQMNGNIEYAKIKIMLLSLTNQLHYLLQPMAVQADMTMALQGE